MDKIINLLKKEKQFLAESFGVEELGVFGSVARGNATSDSDIAFINNI